MLCISRNLWDSVYNSGPQQQEQHVLKQYLLLYQLQSFGPSAYFCCSTLCCWVMRRQGVS